MVATYKNLDFADKEELIKKNTLLVKKIAWHYHGRVKNIVEIDDLIQIGMLGLISAANNFTERPGVGFASYAKIRIKGEIVDFLRKNSNLCRTTITNKQKFEKTVENLRKIYNREPSNEEVAKKIGINIDELYTWKEAFAASRLEDIESVYDEFSIWFHSREDTPEENLTDKELRNALLKTLHKLEKSEALVIQLYYVEELNVFEIAKILDVSNGRVSQIKSNAIKKLRHEMKNIL